MALTPRQTEIHDFLVRFDRKYGHAPTIAEIQEHFGLSSPSTVHEQLSALEREGLIRKQKNIQRGIKIVQAGVMNEDLELPLLGVIAAGVPIQAILTRETISVSPDLYAPHRFALRVKGDSMKDEQIVDGDFIIVEPVKDPTDPREVRNSQTVVALVDEGESAGATVKKFYKEGNVVRLQPANEAYKPIVIEPPRQVQIQGVVVGLIRKYKK